LKGGLFITTNDIRIICDCSLRKAQLELKTLSDILQIKRNKITVRAYCKYWDLNYQDVIDHINQYR
ncbi:MAG: hypothetical protein MK086_14200, partial [Flavobacteriales bacterium]|nr:hypothetical protein [Flavobacteriales bacterium]